MSTGYNPQTGAPLHFAPEASMAAGQRSYFSQGAQFRGIAAATGVAGGYLEKGFLGAAGLFVGGGLAYEAGAVGWAIEEGVPLVARVAVRAYRVAAPAARAYAQHAAKGMATRMFVDAGFQFGTGYLAADPNKGSKSIQARDGINGTSVLAAGAISVGEVKTAAKFLVALGSAAATNLVTVSGENVENYGSYGHMVDFHDSNQTVAYVRNVILGTLFDQGKEYGAEWVAKRAVGRLEGAFAHASGRTSQAVLRWVTETRVALPTGLVLGGVPEVLKKKWEQRREAQEKQEAAEKAAARPPAPAHPHTPPAR